MNFSLRSQMIHRLADFMQGLPKESVRSLAHELTCDISTSVAGKRPRRGRFQGDCIKSESNES